MGGEARFYSPGHTPGDAGARGRRKEYRLSNPEEQELGAKAPFLCTDGIFSYFLLTYDPL